MVVLLLEVSDRIDSFKEGEEVPHRERGPKGPRHDLARDVEQPNVSQRTLRGGGGGGREHLLGRNEIVFQLGGEEGDHVGRSGRRSHGVEQRQSLVAHALGGVQEQGQCTHTHVQRHSSLQQTCEKDDEVDEE